MELHVPASIAVTDVKGITDGLDAVVLGSEMSAVHEGHVRLLLAGNARDLAIAAKRASELGGKVD